jgi:hypothetical protein
MYYDRYPVGHPKKIIKPANYDPEWFGFAYVKILPPRKLYLPVLPYKQKPISPTNYYLAYVELAWKELI